MCVWAEVTSRSPLCLVWKPLNGRTAAGKTPLDLPETQNHYELFVMEERRGGQKKERGLVLFEEDFGGLRFGHRYELQATHRHTQPSKNNHQKTDCKRQDGCSFSCILGLKVQQQQNEAACSHPGG